MARVATVIIAVLAATALVSIVGRQASAQTVTANASISGPQGSLHRYLAAYAAANAKGLPVNITINTRFSGPAQDLFLTGGADFVVADIPLEQGRIARASAPLTQFPVIAGAVQFHHSLPGVTRQLRLEACTLASIYSGKITAWDDPEILARNRALRSSLANRKITVVARNDASNFTTLVTEYLRKGCPSRWTLPVNQSITWPASVTAVPGNALAGSLTNITGAIVYLDLTAAAALPAALAESAIAIEGPGSRSTFYTATTGTFDTLGWSYNVSALGLNDWAGTSFVWETRNNRIVPRAYQKQYPIAFLGYFVGYADVTAWAARGVLVKEYTGLLLGPYGQNASLLASFGWRPLPPAFRDASLAASLRIRQAQPVTLPSTWF